MKKKIVAMCATVAIAAVAVGGTLAYFTDTDAQTNTFTMGNVAIDLYEDFGDNTGSEELIPATGSAQAGTLENGIKKEVYVENTGSEDAYVRVHIAIPQILDDGADTFDASANLLHFNFDKNSIGKDKWDWSKTTGAEYTGDWNFYTVQIDGVWYNVYVVTYEKALINGEVTVDAIDQVYLDPEVTNEDISQIKETLGDNWYIYVAAEGAQKAGFENAYEALNAAFGVPGTYSVDWTTVTGKTTATA